MLSMRKVAFISQTAISVIKMAAKHCFIFIVGLRVLVTLIHRNIQYNFVKMRIYLQVAQCNKN